MRFQKLKLTLNVKSRCLVALIYEKNCSQSLNTRNKPQEIE
jgi:hypothetical protein